MRRSLAALAALPLLLTAPRAWSQSERPTLLLRWSAPRECPQQARARQLVAEYLGETSLLEPTPGARLLQARAAIRKRGPRWELQLETLLDGEPGERTLAAGTCSDVADAAALVLALAIDPGAALRHGTPKQSAPKPAPVVAATPAPRSEPEPLRLGVLASVRGDLGALPGPTVGAGLGVVLERAAFGVTLGGTVLAGRSTPSRERPSAGGDFSLWALALLPCWAPAYRGDLRLRVCAELEWQRLHATGYGVDVSVSARRHELALGAELQPGLRLSSRFELVLPLGLVAATQRPEFYLERIGTVFRASAWQGRAGLGLLGRF